MFLKVSIQTVEPVVSPIDRDQHAGYDRVRQ